MSLLSRFTHISVQNRILAVIVIASGFLILELVVGFITRSLALVADAFHIFSDIIGYVVALLAARYGARSSEAHERYTYGYRRAETLGGFFNGAFLMALGVSILLQSIERFTEPAEITNPVLVMAVGAAGVGSNVFMLLALGGHSHGGHSHSHNDHQPEEHTHAGSGPDGTYPESSAHDFTPNHEGHAHTLRNSNTRVSRFGNVNILGVLIHIAGDAINSVAVIISAGIYLATGFVYADPIASFFVGCMIVGTAWPLVVRSGRSLLVSAPDTIDVNGVREDIERITGPDSVHDLHVWSIDSKISIASLHLRCDNDSIVCFDTISENIRKCLHLWGIHSVTIQPEPESPSMSGRVPELADNTVDPSAAEFNSRDGRMLLAGTPQARSAMRCERQCAHACPEQLVK